MNKFIIKQGKQSCTTLETMNNCSYVMKQNTSSKGDELKDFYILYELWNCRSTRFIGPMPVAMVGKTDLSVVTFVKYHGLNLKDYLASVELTDTDRLELLLSFITNIYVLNQVQLENRDLKLDNIVVEDLKDKFIFFIVYENTMNHKNYIFKLEVNRCILIDFSLTDSIAQSGTFRCHNQISEIVKNIAKNIVLKSKQKSKVPEFKFTKDIIDLIENGVFDSLKCNSMDLQKVINEMPCIVVRYGSNN